MDPRPGPTIPDGSLGDPGSSSWSGAPPAPTRPSIAQGRPSQVHRAGPGALTLLGGGCALLVVVLGICGVALYLFTNVGDLLFSAPPPPPRRPAIVAPPAPRPAPPRPPGR